MEIFNLQQAVAHGVTALSSVSDSARLDAELLLQNVIKQDRTYLFTWSGKTLTQVQQIEYLSLLSKRQQGQPIAHILGYKEFWSLPLATNPSTLIPRPDTETLVEVALDLNIHSEAEVLDLGTGTGAIVLALASERPNWQCFACDRIQQAVELAQSNQQRLAINNVSICQSDWFSAFSEQKFDLIVSNPPYIDEDDPHLKQGDVRYEPLSALVAEESGIADIKTIISDARSHLKSGAFLAIEHGYDQAKIVSALFAQMAYKEISCVQDLGGNDRVTIGRWL